MFIKIIIQLINIDIVILKNIEDACYVLATLVCAATHEKQKNRFRSSDRKYRYRQENA